MLVLSSPSGAGKSTLTRILTARDDKLRLSISVTTRPRRHSEADGVHYHFIDLKTFRQMKEAGDLLESAEVHGNHYGTPRQQVEDALAAGRDVLFDIDWQGTQQLARAMPDDLVRVFVLPPSMEELQARLERRAEDDPDIIARRLAAGRDEIRHWEEYDYVIVNDDLDRSLHDVQAILAAERRRRIRQPGLASFVEGLLVAKAAERA
ncbi:MAG: guanylate kinase [Bauldia sp.]|nr:guanylate kinase [Bauldia sp.]MCW5716657.1 guanylate kinase [Bauldia sp.]